MKRIIYTLLLALLFSFQGVYAQLITHHNIKFEKFDIKKETNSVTIDFMINFSDLKLGTSDLIVLTPTLRSQDMANQFQVRPIVVTGKQRSITLQRAMEFEDYKFDSTPQGIFRRYNGKQQSIGMTITAPYAAWMENCDLVIMESVMCCGLNEESANEYKVLSPVFEQEEVIIPEYTLSYIMPPVEEIKQRSETYSAQLNFTVDKSEIERSLMNNAEILDEVDKIITDIQKNENLSNITFRIVGYASPEGGQLHNMQLAQDRSKAFAYYLTDKYDIPSGSLKLDWMGDDWAGLYQAVKESDVSYKNEIIKALETIDPVRRKDKLKQVAGGKAYRILMDEFYPALRRNEYTISYVAKAFDLEEAKAQLLQHPEHLSLNEMFIVANSYPKSSEQFKEVFEIAARIYPDDPIAQQNMAAINIEDGDYDSAISRLKDIETPEACNNIAVAYAKKGDPDMAIEYFDEAISLGSQDAVANRKLLNDF